MPSTVTGVAIGAASGGAIGGLLGGPDYGVMMGAVIGAAASVIASRDNNGRKIILFLLAFLCGVLIATPLSDLIMELWGVNVNPRIAAIITAAFAIPIILFASSRENMGKAARWLSELISSRFGGRNGS